MTIPFPAVMDLFSTALEVRAPQFVRRASGPLYNPNKVPGALQAVAAFPRLSCKVIL